MKARIEIFKFTYFMGWRNGIVVAMLALNKDNLDSIS